MVFLSAGIGLEYSFIGLREIHFAWRFAGIILRVVLFEANTKSYETN